MPSLDIVYIITNGFASRLVVGGGVLAALRNRGCRVGILTSQPVDPILSDYAGRLGCSVLPVLRRDTRWESLLARARPYILSPVRDNRVAWSRHLRVVNGCEGSRSERAICRILRIIGLVSERSETVKRAFRALQASSVKDEELVQVFRAVQPRVVISTFPIDPRQGRALNQAKTCGVPTIGHIQSWDNVTSKPSAWMAVPDKFIAWGPIMSEELQAVFGIEQAAIHQVGVPTFDLQRTLCAEEKGTEVLRSLDLDPQRPFLLYGMSAPAWVPTEMELVERLAEGVLANEFGHHMQLAVRPHPAVASGHIEGQDWLKRLAALSSTRVRISMPKAPPGALAGSLSDEEYATMANLVRSCSVCINAGSTLSLDALLHDRPVVLTRFDMEASRPWWDSARRCFEFEHIVRLVSMKGVRVADSFPEMCEAIREYLDAPSKDASRTSKNTHIGVRSMGRRRG